MSYIGCLLNIMEITVDKLSSSIHMSSFSIGRHSYTKLCFASGKPKQHINPIDSPSARMRSEGYGTWSVCVCVCVSVPLICDPRLESGLTAIPMASALCGHCFKRGVFPKTGVFCLPRRSPLFLPAGVQLYTFVYFLRTILPPACIYVTRVRLFVWPTC